jgi:hypothetical protein
MRFVENPDRPKTPRCCGQDMRFRTANTTREGDKLWHYRCNDCLGVRTIQSGTGRPPLAKTYEGRPPRGPGKPKAESEAALISYVQRIDVPSLDELGELLARRWSDAWSPEEAGRARSYPEARDGSAAKSSAKARTPGWMSSPAVRAGVRGVSSLGWLSCG